MAVLRFGLIDQLNLYFDLHTFDLSYWLKMRGTRCCLLSWCSSGVWRCLRCCLQDHSRAFGQGLSDLVIRLSIVMLAS